MQYRENHKKVKDGGSLSTQLTLDDRQRVPATMMKLDLDRYNAQFRVYTVILQGKSSWKADSRLKRGVAKSCRSLQAVPLVLSA